MAADTKLPFDAALHSVLSSLEHKFILKKRATFGVQLFYYQEGGPCPATNRLWQKPVVYELRTDAFDRQL